MFVDLPTSRQVCMNSYCERRVSNAKRARLFSSLWRPRELRLFTGWDVSGCFDVATTSLKVTVSERERDTNALAISCQGCLC